MLGKKIPQGVRESVNKYLAAIRDTDPEFRNVAKGFFEYSLGHNSNVNSSADQTIIFPIRDNGGGLILAIPVTPPSPQSSSFSQVALGGVLNGPLAPGIKFLVGGEASQRQFASVDQFDQTSATAFGGVEYAGDEARYRLVGFYSQIWLDSTELRDATGLSVDWFKPITKEVTGRSSLTYAQLRYDGANALTRDADLYAFSAGFTKFLGGAWKWSFDGDFSFQKEDNIRNRPDFSRDSYGVKGAFNAIIGGRWKAGLAVGYAYSDYDSRDPLSVDLAAKDEKLLTAELGLQYQLTRGWSVRGEYAFTRNTSNVNVYEYEQNLALIKMRYEWK